MDKPAKQPLKALKQMSAKRHDLEKSSDRISSDLERLQQINEEQNQRISNTLTELQLQQLTNERLLQSDWTKQKHLEEKEVTSPSSRKLQREPSVLRKLRLWGTTDVIQWLENRKLHKFVLIFQRHHVTGPDLADINLPFLETYEHISTEEREHLLAEVYDLLHLQLDDDDDLLRITTPKEKEKYMAAKQIAKDRDHAYHRSQSVPAVFLSPNSSPSSSSPSSTSSSPTAKQRKKSDSETHGILGRLVQKPNLLQLAPNRNKGSKSPNPIRKSLEKLKPKKKSSSSSPTLYDLLDGHPGQYASCYMLQKQNGQFGISLETRSDGHTYVTHTNPELHIKVGDRVLEINGCPCMHNSGIEELYKDTDHLFLVTSSVPTNLQDSSPTHDWKWQRLRSYLQGIKDQDIDTELMLEGLPQGQIQDIRDKTALQEELESVRSQMSDQYVLIQKLQEELESSKAELEEAREDKAKAVDALRAKSHSRRANKDATRSGEKQYYKMTMESLNLESASKDQVMESLKEIVKEASRQKYYLDRLISVVIEDVPWILEQVDADFDNIPMDGQSEEFC